MLDYRYIETCREILRHIEFLNFKFELEEGPRSFDQIPEAMMSTATLLLKYNNHDNDNNGRYGKPTSIVFRTMIRIDLPPTLFVESVFDAVMRVVRHESGELFIFSGQRPFNEHNNQPSHQILREIFSLEEHWKR